MQVAQLENGESVKAGGNLLRNDIVRSESYIGRIPASSPIQSRHHQARLDNEMRPRKIFEMKVVDSLPEDLSLMIGLDANAQSGMESS